MRLLRDRSNELVHLQNRREQGSGGDHDLGGREPDWRRLPRMIGKENEMAVYSTEPHPVDAVHINYRHSGQANKRPPCIYSGNRVVLHRNRLDKRPALWLGHDFSPLAKYRQSTTYSQKLCAVPDRKSRNCYVGSAGIRHGFRSAGIRFRHKAHPSTACRCVIVGPATFQNGQPNSACDSASAAKATSPTIVSHGVRINPPSVFREAA